MVVPSIDSAIHMRIPVVWVLSFHFCRALQDKIVQWFDSKKVFYFALLPLVAFYALYAGASFRSGDCGHAGLLA